MNSFLKKSVLAAFLLASLSGWWAPLLAAEGDSVFIDVASNHPHFQAIEYLYQKGIVEGYPDHSFRPDKDLNRAEALKMILLGARVLAPDIQDQEIFPDVLSDSWYAPYVLKAKNLGIIRGDDGTGLFRPGDTVNLAEALKMILFTSEIHPDPVRKDPYPTILQDAWFAPHFAYAKSHGLLDDDRPDPGKSVDRGLLAELIYRLDVNPQGKVDTYASFYGDAFHGRGTASGETFDQNQLTAAHRTYPFGTLLKVTNANNGKSVVVRVNDRGPYAGKNRVIDLSKAAFETIASVSNGVIPVILEEVSPEDQPTIDEGLSPQDFSGDLLALNPACPATDNFSLIDPNEFEGIRLDHPLSTQWLANESVTIQGAITLDVPMVNLLLIDDHGEQFPFEGAVAEGRFQIRVHFPHPGHFQLGLIPGREGRTTVKDIDVLPADCLREKINPATPSVSSADLVIRQGDLVISWNPSPYNLFKITLRQGPLLKSALVRNASEWIPSYAEFKEFQEGKTELFIRGAMISGDAVLKNPEIVWSPAYFQEFLATRHFQYQVDLSKVVLRELSPHAALRNVLRAVIEPKADLRQEAALITPEDPVQKVLLRADNLSARENDKKIAFFPKGPYPLSLEYNVTDIGTHFVEINDVEGIAAVNVPVYAKNQYPLLPDTYDLTHRTLQDLGQNLPALRQPMLDLLNRDRKEFGKGALSLDQSLTELAQFRADDMSAKNYFGHWDAQGKGAEELKSGFGIKTAITENLAKEVDIPLAEYGLMRSAIHRDNILNPEWTRVGLGIQKAQDGSYLFVQLFSADPIDPARIDLLREQLLEPLNLKRTPPLELAGGLNQAAQEWSVRMAEQDFFGWTDPSGSSLLDEVRKIEPRKKIGVYIVENSSFHAALDQVAANAQLQESGWSSLGIGLAQDNVGVIKITLIYTE